MNPAQTRVKALVEEVALLCLQRGLRLTPLRSDVLQLVAQSRKPLKAYKVLERIVASQAITAPPTAYRTLNFLVEHGFVHKLESMNAFIACDHPGQQHTATFLICDGFNVTFEIRDKHLEQLVKGHARAVEFTSGSTSQTLEVQGQCRDCDLLSAVLPSAP